MKETFGTEFVNLFEDERIKAMKKVGDEAWAVAGKWMRLSPDWLATN